MFDYEHADLKASETLDTDIRSSLYFFATYSKLRGLTSLYGKQRNRVE